MIKVGIIGSTGYAGAELVRILLAHKDAEIKWYGSRSYIDKKYADVYQNMFQLVDDVCKDDNMKQLAKEVDVIFTATPQGLCASLVDDEILSNTKIIDLSADFRIKDVNTYEEWYKIEHKSPQYIEEAVYGLCEINRDKVKNARLIANPGCYPTCSTLSIYPMLKEGLIDASTIIIDAKSGTSGAGRGAKVDNLYCEVNENIKAYGVATHRHTPEIEQTLSSIAGESIEVTFTPHLLPINRGILSTIYCETKNNLSLKSIHQIYNEFYKNEKFLQVLPLNTTAEIKNVKYSNNCQISLHENYRKNKLIIISTIDNMIKGAAGQAIQNLNLILGLNEDCGLNMISPPF